MGQQHCATCPEGCCRGDRSLRRQTGGHDGREWRPCRQNREQEEKSPLFIGVFYCQDHPGERPPQNRLGSATRQLSLVNKPLTPEHSSGPMSLRPTATTTTPH